MIGNPSDEQWGPGRHPHTAVHELNEATTTSGLSAYCLQPHALQKQVVAKSFYVFALMHVIASLAHTAEDRRCSKTRRVTASLVR